MFVFGGSQEEEISIKPTTFLEQRKIVRAEKEKLANNQPLL
jgi:hypothetical protein